MILEFGGHRETLCVVVLTMKRSAVCLQSPSVHDQTPITLSTQNVRRFHPKGLELTTTSKTARNQFFAKQARAEMRRLCPFRLVGEVTALARNFNVNVESKMVPLQHGRQMVPVVVRLCRDMTTHFEVVQGIMHLVSIGVVQGIMHLVSNLVC